MQIYTIYFNIFVFSTYKQKYMYKKFINKCDELLSSFKETGDIEALLYLESHISNFLDHAVEDYLDEINDSYITENTKFSSDPNDYSWTTDATL
jgi:hypothetical protein